MRWLVSGFNKDKRQAWLELVTHLHNKYRRQDEDSVFNEYCFSHTSWIHKRGKQDRTKTNEMINNQIKTRAGDQLQTTDRIKIREHNTHLNSLLSQLGKKEFRRAKREWFIRQTQTVFVYIQSTLKQHLSDNFQTRNLIQLQYILQKNSETTESVSL